MSKGKSIFQKNMWNKFKNRKVCRVCYKPIVFYKDAWWKDNGVTRDNHGELVKYPLNIHYHGCRHTVELSSEDVWTWHNKSSNPYKQLNLNSLVR